VGKVEVEESRESRARAAKEVEKRTLPPLSAKEAAPCAYAVPSAELVRSDTKTPFLCHRHGTPSRLRTYSMRQLEELQEVLRYDTSNADSTWA
jgi:hypothetical protein